MCCKQEHKQQLGWCYAVFSARNGATNILKYIAPLKILLIGAANLCHHFLVAGDSVALAYWCY
jgi:hypothetical protein